jgi:hypothetical protein
MTRLLPLFLLVLAGVASAQRARPNSNCEWPPEVAGSLDMKHTAREPGCPICARWKEKDRRETQPEPPPGFLRHSSSKVFYIGPRVLTTRAMPQNDSIPRIK